MTTTVTTSDPRATASQFVQDKAALLYNAGRVRRIAEDEFSVTYRVRSDYVVGRVGLAVLRHKLTYTVLQHRENIDADRCTCAWNRYQPYNTAVCSHVLAARFESVVPISRWRKALLWLAEKIGR